MSFDFPSNNQVLKPDGTASISWLQWFQIVHTVVSSLKQSGTTANRPTSMLWIGRRYYDTTLGKPIWVHSVRPTVWHDASGAAV